MTGTDWLTAIGILLSGAVIGFMFLYATTRKKGGTPDTEAAMASAAARPVEVRDLEAKRDGLIAHLRELADMGGNEEEISRLEHEAANVLRQLDGLAVVQAKGERGAASGERGKATARGQRPANSDPRTATSEQRPASALKGFLWGVGSAAAIAGLVFFVINQAKSRESGGSVTGGTTMGGQSAAQPMQQPQGQGQGQTNGQPGLPDPELQKLEAAVQATPDDLDARNNLAHAYLERENMVAAFEQAQTVLTKAPADPRANTVQAIVRIAMGESEQASKQLEAATKNDPKLTDAWVALAWAYTQSGRDAEADKAINSAVKQNPEQEARLRDVLGKMRQQAKIQPAAKHPAVDGSGEVSPANMPGGGGGAGGGAGAGAADNGKGVKVTLTIAPGAKAPASNILYIIVRDAGQTSGPPSAVKRVTITGFPMTVDVTAADSMMGGALPDKMRVEARLDTDGNAMTKEPTDLDAVKDGVAAGGTVALALAQTHS